MIAVLLRCIIIYALLLAALRLTGKRQMGELDVSELITALILSEVAVLPISDPDAPMSYAVLPIFALSAVEVIITFLTSKKPGLRSFISGRPNAVIKNGRIDQAELNKLRVSAAELMSQLRINGVANPFVLKYAFFEKDGQLSVIENDADYVYTLVNDGCLNRFNITESGWTEARIMKKLKTHNTDIKDVFLMTVDTNGKTTIIYKE